MSDLDEINMEEHENTRKKLQSRLGKKGGIMLAPWNIRGKNDGTHNSKWPRIMRLKRIAILAIQEARTIEEDIVQIEAVVPKINKNHKWTILQQNGSSVCHQSRSR